MLLKFLTLKSKYFATVILFIFLIAGCKQDKRLSAEDARHLPADFISFYERFHRDSVYQMAHIQFPLDGLPSQADSSMTGLYKYTVDNWTFQTLKGFNETDFIRRFEIPIPELVNESIIQKGVGFGTYRRFYKRSGEWKLIYYSDVNKISEK